VTRPTRSGVQRTIEGVKTYRNGCHFVEHDRGIKDIVGGMRLPAIAARPGMKNKKARAREKEGIERNLAPERFDLS